MKSAIGAVDGKRPERITRSEVTEYLIVVGLIYREDEVLLVEQRGKDDADAHWTVPGGKVEPDELPIDALKREIAEETGLIINDPRRLVYLAQLDDRLNGNAVTILAFEVFDWSGTLVPSDPDGFILQASFVPRERVVALNRSLPWRNVREPLDAYLCGIAPPGSVWRYERDDAGVERLIPSDVREVPD